jgi:sialate O-acetylesterase
MNRSPLYLFSFLCLFCLHNDAVAAVRLAGVFTNHMVLQRDREVPVWGWADPGETVEVRFGDASIKTKAGTNGRFEARLPSMKASNKGQDLLVTGQTGKVVLSDVLVGDVWLCGGQSNMDWPLHLCKAPADIASANHSAIRHFAVDFSFSSAPREDCQGQWQVCTPQTAGGFTAVGYYFAKKVHKETGIPIGILRSSVGGTNIELWMSQKTLMETPALEPFAKSMRESLELWRKELARDLHTMDNWSARVKEALKNGAPIPPPPAFPEYPFGEKMFRPRCVTLYNGMIHPIIPFAVRGFLWYQGESNAGPWPVAAQYIEKKKALVADWRNYFGGGAELPFYFVQLAAWQKPNDDPAVADDWAHLREAQRHCLKAIPSTGMAVATDIGDADDIHPANKGDVGERLARWALRDVYGKKDREVSGPLFLKATPDDSRLVVEFEHAKSGLMAASKNGRNAPQAKDSSPGGFTIAGADRRWQWANARIEENRVILSHPAIAKPIAVRYGYSINPVRADLYNKDGLPASPFRSDDW